jgi:hypothetical protein
MPGLGTGAGHGPVLPQESSASANEQATTHERQNDLFPGFLYYGA